jgi:hypothetical protein
MRLWAALYGAIWIVFVEFLLAMAPQGRPYSLYGHFALGFGIVAIAYYNFDALRRTTAPGRVKRIASATYYLAIVTAVLGIPLVFNVGAGWPLVPGITVWNLIMLVHVANAFAIITQMAATAIAFDMWEEKEFLGETRPGEIPPNPSNPVAPARMPHWLAARFGGAVLLFPCRIESPRGDPTIGKGNMSRNSERANVERVLDLLEIREMRPALLAAQCRSEEAGVCRTGLPLGAGDLPDGRAREHSRPQAGSGDPHPQAGAESKKIVMHSSHEPFDPREIGR